jgi:hypothetical protein
MGGLRRRKEGTIAVAYDLPGLDTVVGIRRLLDIVVTDGVGLDNGTARRRSGRAPVTAERRLARLETSLSPTQLVLCWLDEAHAFGDLESYVRSQLAEPSYEGPLDRLAREAVSGVRTTLRGKRPEIVDAAIRSTLRETVFRFELVMRILVTTHELVEREVLIDAALSAHLALLTSEGRAARRRDATYPERFARLRGLLLFRVGELRAAQEARSAV